MEKLASVWDVLAKKEMETFYTSKFQTGKLLRKFGKLQKCSPLLRETSIWDRLVTHSLAVFTKDTIFGWTGLSPEIHMAGTQKADMRVKL